MEDSKIEWCDHTFNPWIGCTQVSPGCLHCYAENRDKRHLIEDVDHWGKGAPRLRTSPANWRKPLRWEREVDLEALELAPHCRMMLASDALAQGDREQCERIAAYHRPRVFCASLADWLDNEVPIEWLADLLKLIHDTPNLDWLLLTKRPQNWRHQIGLAMLHFSRLSDFGENEAPMKVWEWLLEWHGGKPPANVWIGTTVEDQTRADQRIPLLLDIPARVRFLSCEPLLGPVLLDNGEASWLSCTGCAGEDACRSILIKGEHFHGIDWVIAGGESGPGSRPMHPDWARSLREQCASAGVPFLFKQWGEWAPDDGEGTKGEWRGFRDGQLVKRVGKHAAGRLLDGIEHNGFPFAYSAETGRLR